MFYIRSSLQTEFLLNVVRSWSKHCLPPISYMIKSLMLFIILSHCQHIPLLLSTIVCVSHFLILFLNISSWSNFWHQLSTPLLVLQVVHAILIVVLGTMYDINKEAHQRGANIINNVLVGVTIVTVVINIVISAFDIRETSDLAWKNDPQHGLQYQPGAQTAPGTGWLIFMRLMRVEQLFATFCFEYSYIFINTWARLSSFSIATNQSSRLWIVLPFNGCSTRLNYTLSE